MKALFLVGIFFLGCCWADTATIYQHLITQATGTTNSPNVKSLGQTGHLGFVVFSDAPSHSCTAPLGTGKFQGSFDNVSFIDFGTDGQTNLVNLVNTVSATGNFPYVRFRLQGFDNVSCRADVYYSGSTTAPLVNTNGAIPYGAAGLQNPVVIGGMGLNTTLVLPVCGAAGFSISGGFSYSSTTAINIPAGSSHAFIGSTPAISPGTASYVCGLILTGSAAGTTATLFAATDNTCSTPIVDRTTGPLPIGQSLVQFGGGIGSIFTLPTNTWFCISAGTGNLNGVINLAQF